MLSRFAIATAAHCVPHGASSIDLTIRRGARGVCLSGGKGNDCNSAHLTVSTDDEADFAILGSQQPLLADGILQFPLIALTSKPKIFDAWGFGTGYYRDSDGQVIPIANGERLLHAPISVGLFSWGEVEAARCAESKLSSRTTGSIASAATQAPACQGDRSTTAPFDRC